MGLIPISIAVLLTVTSIECSYYYYTSHNQYYPTYQSSVASPYVQPPYTYYAPRLSRPIYYIRPLSRSGSRPQRKFARSNKFSSQPTAESGSTIILNDTAVPFTVTNAALSTLEYERAPEQAAEEGVGPALEVEAPVPHVNLPASSKVPSISSKGSAGKEKSKSKFGQKKPSFEPEVVYSDFHPIYVKPPTDFRPIVYPNRRLDGLQATNKFANQLTLQPPMPPFPYGYPRGLSSWTFGGPKAVTRGNYWESLSSDEALNLQPEGNTIHPTTSHATSASKFNSNVKPSSQRPLPMPSLMPWFLVPSTSSLFSYEIQYPSPSNSIAIMPLSHSSPRKAKPTSSSKKDKKPLSPAAMAKSKSEGIRTKLPVGLSSWMLGGVRDLTGKHWKMPDMFVDNVSVIEMDNSSANGNKSKEADPDIMMTSDGDYEKVVPVIVSAPAEGEKEEEDAGRESGVVFDDDHEFLNANNNINLS